MSSYDSLTNAYETELDDNIYGGGALVGPLSSRREDSVSAFARRADF
jgi:hypothetical protein